MYGNMGDSTRMGDSHVYGSMGGTVHVHVSMGQIVHVYGSMRSVHVHRSMGECTRVGVRGNVYVRECGEVQCLWRVWGQPGACMSATALPDTPHPVEA